VVEAALAPLAIEAAQKAASCAVCAVVDTAHGSSWIKAKDKEQQWQREKLAQLIEEHKENHAARQKELSRWQQHLEDALFE
jgi:septal ring factor EnvC (AmiA/AmiB activator)